MKSIAKSMYKFYQIDLQWDLQSVHSLQLYGESTKITRFVLFNKADVEYTQLLAFIQEWEDNTIIHASCVEIIIVY